MPSSTTFGSTLASSITNESAQTELRGVALLVGISELDLIKNGISPQRLISELRAKVAELLPETSAETAAIGAIVPRGMAGSDIELTKLAIAKSLGVESLTPAPPKAPIQPGLRINLDRRRVQIDGVTIELTCREFELLAVLAQAAGEVLSREYLAELASQCNESAGLEPIQNIRSMDVYVRRLRAKLGDYADVVQTVRGMGYRFAASSEVKVSA